MKIKTKTIKEAKKSKGKILNSKKKTTLRKQKAVLPYVLEVTEEKKFLPVFSAQPKIETTSENLKEITLINVNSETCGRFVSLGFESKGKSNFEYSMSKMSKVWVLLFTVFMSFGVLTTGDTNSYYKDEEKSLSNTMTTGALDFVLFNGDFIPKEASLNLEFGTTTTKVVGMALVNNSNPMTYHASTTNVTGDIPFCQGIDLNVSFASTSQFTGKLTNFYSNPATTTIGDWNYSFSVPTGFYNSICSFDFEYTGRQTVPHQEIPNGGYWDSEIASSTIYSSGFRINKVYYDVAPKETFTPMRCEARSQGYWSQNEGCSGGSGFSPRAGDVGTLSNSLSGAFSGITGPQVCVTMDIPSCPTGNNTDAKRCRAKVHALADELNVVSGKLDLNAIIAGAYNASNSIHFYNLGLSASSTIGTALNAIEAIIVYAGSPKWKLDSAAKVAERIYTFYENENPSAPFCQYNESTNNNLGRGEEGDNEWVEIYNQADVSLDINGWQICDNTSCDTLASTSPLMIPAKGFAVVTASSTTWNYWNVPDDVLKIVLGNKIGNGLANDADMLVLKRPDNVIIDQMNWGVPSLSWANYNSDVWNPGATDVPEGHALGRKPNGYDTNAPSDFVDLAMPSLTILSPDETEGQIWYWDSYHNITWFATNPNGDSSDIKINIYLIKDTDQSITITPADEVSVIALNEPNDGDYYWQVPDGFVGHIWIKIVAVGPENPMLNSQIFSGKVFDPFTEEMWANPIQREMIINSLRSAGLIAQDYVPASLAEVEEIVARIMNGSAVSSDVVDPYAPVITLLGDSPARIPLGSSYIDVGATAVDFEGAPLMPDITENTVNTLAVGEYKVVWTAHDSDLVYSSVTRTVIVFDPFVQGLENIISDLAVGSSGLATSSESNLTGDGQGQATSTSSNLGQEDLLQNNEGDSGGIDDTATSTLSIYLIDSLEGGQGQATSTDSILDEETATSTLTTLGEGGAESGTTTPAVIGDIATSTLETIEDTATSTSDSVVSEDNASSSLNLELATTTSVISNTEIPPLAIESHPTLEIVLPEENLNNEGQATSTNLTN